MSRSRKALISAGFVYVQYAFATITALFLTRLLLEDLGRAVYGLWTASSALLAYAGWADLGLFGVMPWLVANADGQRDLTKLRSLVAHGLALGLLAGGLFFAIGAGLFWSIPSFLHLTDAETSVVRGPLLLMLGLTLAGFPLKVFNATLAGLQDVTFMGVLGALQVALTGVLSIGLVMGGFGLYGLAVGTALPPLIGSLLAFGRTVLTRSDLLRHWPRLSLREVTPLFTGGAGAWMGSMGWQLTASSDPIVIGHLGHLALVPVYAVTARLGTMLMQMGWALPDGGLVGLAQLHGEGLHERVRAVLRTMLRLHLLVSGAIAVLLLAVNPVFVKLWVGEAMFGGLVLNALCAAAVIVRSCVHALLVPVSVLGARLEVGLATLFNGAVHVALALVGGALLGLPGIALAAVLSPMVSSVPIGARLMRRCADVRPRELVARELVPWLVRFVPLGALGFVLGHLARDTGLLMLLGQSALVGLVYLWWMRPLYQDLPLGPRLRRSLQALRLVSGSAA